MWSSLILCCPSAPQDLILNPASLLCFNLTFFLRSSHQVFRCMFHDSMMHIMTLLLLNFDLFIRRLTIIITQVRQFTRIRPEDIVKTMDHVMLWTSLKAFRIRIQTTVEQTTRTSWISSYYVTQCQGILTISQLHTSVCTKLVRRRSTALLICWNRAAGK